MRIWAWKSREKRSVDADMTVGKVGVAPRMHFVEDPTAPMTRDLTWIQDVDLRDPDICLNSVKAFLMGNNPWWAALLLFYFHSPRFLFTRLTTISRACSQMKFRHFGGFLGPLFPHYGWYGKDYPDRKSPDVPSYLPDIQSPLSGRFARLTKVTEKENSVELQVHFRQQIACQRRTQTIELSWVASRRETWNRLYIMSVCWSWAF